MSDDEGDVVMTNGHGRGRNRRNGVAGGQDLDHFDPDQSLEERREIQRGMRDLIKRTTEQQDDLLASDGRLFAEMLGQSDDFIRKTKQTSEATIDSRFVLGMAELAYKRSVRVTTGSAANGVDVDEFVSKVITYMRHGRGISDDGHAELSSTQRQRRTTNGANGRRNGARASGSNRAAAASSDEEEDDEVGDSGDMLNWKHFGKYACVPYVRRPALPGFLLGPLSVQKKIRKVGRRAAPLRINNLQEVRPEVLDPDAVGAGASKHERNDLTATCARIYRHLQQCESKAQQDMSDAVDALPEEERGDPDVLQALYDRHAVRDTGGIDLIRFAINPHSFAQTVENIFYISFLIRDGKLTLDFDDNGLPSLSATDEDDPEAQQGNSLRQQAIISIDEETWRDTITTFNIKEPMIPHRKDTSTQGPGARGWYNS